MTTLLVSKEQVLADHIAKIVKRQLDQRMADAPQKVSMVVPAPNVLNEVTVTPAPVNNEVTVQPAPVNNEVTVQPASVNNEITVVPAPVNNEITVTPAPVNNEIVVEPTPVTVRVDMNPVAEALGSMTSAILEQGRLLGELLRLFAEQPLPVINNSINVPEPKKLPAPKKRSFKITHTDGTESTIVEA